MLFKLIAAFTVIPILELYILIKLGSYFGFFTSIILIVGTGIVGAYHAKQQGFTVLHTIQNEMAMGRFPADELIDGLLILIAGIVLLTPGLLTDLAGLLILFPISRVYIRKWLIKKLSQVVSRGNVTINKF